SGLFVLAIAWASSRRPLPLVKGGGLSLQRIERKLRGASSPGVDGLPRRYTCKLAIFELSFSECSTGLRGSGLSFFLGLSVDSDIALSSTAPVDVSTYSL